MLKSEKRISPMDISALVFILLQIVLFPLIQFTSASVSNIASYIAIVLVAILAFLTLRRESLCHPIRIGILFTLVADYFLVLNDKLLCGVLAFTVVQLAYFAYLWMVDKRTGVRRANAISRAALSLVLVAVTFAVLGSNTDALAIASVIYYANLLVNVIFAFLLGNRDRMFAIGLVLFAMCDLCIGLEVLFSSYLDSSALAFFYGARINLPWIFYQPSQALIALHLYKKDR